MKNRKIRITALILSVLISLFTSGCHSSTIEEIPVAPLRYEIKSDKTEYQYGEEIEIEFLFNVYNNDSLNKDGNTYCIKIKESPYYEIIGDGEVYTDGSENDRLINGEYDTYWYRATFKIKITEETDERQYIEIVAKCIEDDWLLPYCEDNSGLYLSDDPEYPFAILKSFGFNADSYGVVFTGTDHEIK